MSRIILGGLEELSEAMCELCATRPAMKDDRLCEECSNRYSTLLRSARDRTSMVNLLSSKYGEGTVPAVSNQNVNRTNPTLAIDNDSTINRTKSSLNSQGSLTQVFRQSQAQLNQPPEPDEAKLRDTLEDLTSKNESLRRQLTQRRRLPSTIICYLLILIGALSLVSSAVFTSNMLAFIGLGLTFWGALLLFIRPQKFVRSDLMDSTALSSLQAVDNFIDKMGYGEKGIYLPGTGNPGNAVVFIPSAPLQGRIPSREQLEGYPFTKEGMTLVPPGLGLADLIQHELGKQFSKFTLEELREPLRKVLVENLEVMDDFDMQIDGNTVRAKYVGSMYADFCSKLTGCKKLCSVLGCPMCSAMACVLAQATGKPVVFTEDKETPDRKLLESTYRILDS